MAAAARLTMVQLTEFGAAIPGIERMPEWFGQAATFGAHLVAFPEYCLGRRIPLDHDHVKRFRDLARRHQMYAVAGLIEQQGERWSTTAIVVSPGGEIVGRYLKVHPAAGPSPHWWPPVPGHDDEARGLLGRDFKVFDLGFARVGILQCYDGYFPEAWGCSAYNGAEIILWLNGRASMVQDHFCLSAAQAYGCVVGANSSDGWNTGFAVPAWDGCLRSAGQAEEARMFPRIPQKGDACCHAEIDLAVLRRHRKHLRTMHQRRPELYGVLTRPVKLWQQYPEIPWDHPECPDYVNRAQLP